MPDALTTLAQCIEDVLLRSSLSLAYRQKAKFEGWLKFELAAALSDQGADVCVESTVTGTKHRADLDVRFPGEAQWLIC